MRYELDNEGYIKVVVWGGSTGNCAEYTGEVPIGYTSLIEWSENALINAYYINEEGNLTLDSERKEELELRIAQETAENTPVLQKDFSVTNEAVEKQYISATANGSFLALDNVKKLDPYIKITDIECYKDSKIEIYTQTKNMLKNDGKTETINGVTFTRYNDSIAINGTATADIEYDLSGSSENATSLFMLLKGTDYYLNIGGFNCEMKYFDGETISQVYIGASGLINLTENKKVTQVILKIPVGTVVNTTIKPQLELGSSASDFVYCETNRLTIDLAEYIEEALFPSDDLFPGDDLFPMGTHISYILIQSGAIYVSANNKLYYYGKGNVRLFNGYNLLYTLQGANIDVEYFIDELKVEEDIEVLSSKIDQTAQNITLEVNKKLESYDTSEEVSSKIQQSANSITSTVSSTYATKGELNIAKSEIKQTTDSITSTVSKKVGNDEIISKINQSAEQISIQADKININGTVSANGNFKVDTDGNMTCNNATMKNINIANGQIRLDGDDNTQIITILKSDSSGLQLEDSYITLKDSNRNGISCYSNLNGEAYMQLVSTGGTTQIKNTGISTPVLNQTSIEENKKNFEKLEDALNIVKDIDIYKYNLKAEEDGTKKHIGFVIGDNYRYSKEVTSTENDGADIYSLASVCLKAIQEQQETMETLQEENRELKARIEALEKGENNG